jgi:hypothetical protein
MIDILAQARIWVGNRSLDMDAEDWYSDADVKEYVSYYYPGGWTAFVEDYGKA